MGNKSSRVAKRASAAVKQTPKTTASAAIEAHLAAALKDLAASGRAERITFNRFMLRLPPLMSVAVVRCQAVFRGLDSDGNGSLTVAELQQGCGRLGYHLSEELVQQIFSTTDADGSAALSLREFVGALCLLHVLKGPQDVEQVDEVVLEAFNTAANAFVSFGGGATGYISLDKLRSAMHEKGTSRVNLMDGVDAKQAETWVADRFAEMDTSHDDKASFLEFLMWLSKAQEEEEAEWEDDDVDGVDAARSFD